MTLLASPRLPHTSQLVRDWSTSMGKLSTIYGLLVYIMII